MSFRTQVAQALPAWPQESSDRHASPSATHVPSAAALEPVFHAEGPLPAYLEVLDDALVALGEAAGAWRARVLAHRSRIRRSLGDNQRATEDARTAFEIALGAGAAREQVLATIEAARLAPARETAHAIAMLERASAAADEIPDEVLACEALLLAGLRAGDVADHEGAAGRLRDGLARAQRAGLARLWAVHLGSLGVIEHRRGRLSEAGALYREARAATTRVREPTAAAVFAMNLGIVHQEQGHAVAAAADFAAARAELLALGHLTRVAICAGFEGALHFERGDLERATACYDDALAVLGALEPAPHRTLFLAARAAVDAARGRLARAADDLAAALARAARESPVWVPAVVALHSGHLDLARARACVAADDTAGALAHHAAAQEKLTHAGGAAPEARVDDVRTAHRILARWAGALGEAPLLVGPEARWFHAPGAARADLGAHEAMRGILLALVHARLRAPGTALDRASLYAAGWPGQRALARSQTNRVHVALATLRRLGLRSVLRVERGAYLLAPEVPLLDTLGA